MIGSWGAHAVDLWWIGIARVCGPPAPAFNPAACPPWWGRTRGPWPGLAALDFRGEWLVHRGRGDGGSVGLERLCARACKGCVFQRRLCSGRSIGPMSRSESPRTDQRRQAHTSAEAVRFELTGPCEPPVFKTGAIDHSATLPGVVRRAFSLNPARPPDRTRSDALRDGRRPRAWP